MQNRRESMREIVKECLRLGMAVFPCHGCRDGMCTCGRADCRSPGKHPLTRRGVYDASKIAEIVDKWFGGSEVPNLGIATGRISRIVVADIDCRHGGDVSLSELERIHGPLPRTAKVATGGGGWHLYFRCPEGVSVKNRTALRPGIDVRADNGHVIGPESIHASGNYYEVVVPFSEGIAELPAWLLEIMVQKADPSTPVLTVQPEADDLTTHPGSGEGERHATLCKLVGRHFARNDDAGTVLELALAWASKCSPPFSRNEVRKVVHDLEDKTAQRRSFVRSESEDEIDSIALPERPGVPSPRDEAFYGVIGEVVRKIEPESEASLGGMLLSFLVGFGNVVGRGPYFRVEGDRHHLNIFATLVGRSSRGRKGTSLGRTLDVLVGDESTWATDRIVNGVSSGEGIIWAVRDKDEGLEAVREKGRIVGYETVIRDHGEEDKRLWIIEAEFGQVLKVMSREGNTVSTVIRLAWDTGNLRVMTRNSRLRATYAHISFLTHITFEELHKRLGYTELFNGFANRFLWALVERSKLLPLGGRPLDFATEKECFRRIIDVASKIGEMKRSSDATDLWVETYSELTRERSGLYGAATGRAEAQALRLSMIYAAADGSPVIEACHLKAALAVWRYCDESARQIFGADQEDPLERVLYEAICSNRGVSRKGLHRLTGGHVPARSLIKALAAIHDRGLVRREMSATGGRPAECWFPCERTNKVVVPAVVSDLSVECRDAVEGGKLIAISDGEQGKEEGVATVGVESSFASGESVVESPVPVVAEMAATEAEVLSLSELLDAVNRMGGRLVHQGGVISVQASGETVSPVVEAAVAANRDALRSVIKPENVLGAVPLCATQAGGQGEVSSEVAAAVERFVARCVADGGEWDYDKMFDELDRNCQQSQEGGMHERQ